VSISVLIAFAAFGYERIPRGAKRICRSVRRPRVRHRYLRWLWQLVQSDKATYLSRKVGLVQSDEATYLFRKAGATHKRLAWSTRRKTHFGRLCSVASLAPTYPALLCRTPPSGMDQQLDQPVTTGHDRANDHRVVGHSTPPPPHTQNSGTITEVGWIVATLIRDISDEDTKRKDWAKARRKSYQAGIASVADPELEQDLLDTSPRSTQTIWPSHCVSISIGNTPRIFF
jgi:hypothetical protein